MVPYSLHLSECPLLACDFIRCWARRSCCCIINSVNRFLSLSQSSNSGIEQASKLEMPKWHVGWPYNTSNGECCKAEWKYVLYQNSASGNYLNHCLGQEWIKHLKNVSKHCLSHSVWPSVWGWYDELISSWVLVSLKSSCHTLLVKTLSLSEIIDSGRPWSI